MHYHIRLAACDSLSCPRLLPLVGRRYLQITAIPPATLDSLTPGLSSKSSGAIPGRFVWFKIAACSYVHQMPGSKSSELLIPFFPSHCRRLRIYSLDAGPSLASKEKQKMLVYSFTIYLLGH